VTQIAKPIIIVGTGRCGSTVFQRLLARHPSTMWLSGFCDRYPHRPDINRRAVTALGNPLLRRLLGWKVQPGEAYYFWDHLAYGFAEPCRDLVRADVTPRVKQRVLAGMGAMLTPARNRLLIKITGWPRLAYLDEIFEDARFIHLVRDGRAVANSLLHVDFWRGWYGPQGWRAGLLSAEDQAVWESYDRSFVALAGLEWRIQMRAMDAARRTIDPARFLEIRYEDFCERPQDTLRQVLDFSELPHAREVDAALAATPIRNASARWREGLTPAQQRILDDLLRDDLRRFGYDAAASAEAARDPVAR
jgi:omega-hydroxy-beta-dihydromenaquinone-9 sulfotransferase